MIVLVYQRRKLDNYTTIFTFERLQLGRNIRYLIYDDP